MKRASSLTETYKNKFQALPSSYVGMCYAGGITLGQVLRKAYEVSLKPSRDDLQKILRGLDLPVEQTKIPGAIKFDADGRNTGARALVTQWKDTGVHKRTIYPSEVATGQPTQLK